MDIFKLGDKILALLEAVKFMREQLMKHYDKVIALLIAFFVNEM